jgi:ubiquinone/menaquinone biosynthesis C-methylase UbiE
MSRVQVDYDQLAATYDQRYKANGLPQIRRALAELVREAAAQTVLEVGCGTGHWLRGLSDMGDGQPAQLLGLDLSYGMLRRAWQQRGLRQLAQGRARTLPYRSAEVDLLYVVNALHHFADRRRFAAEARRLLRRGGRIAIVAFDPRANQEWFIYRYFKGTYEVDLERMISSEAIAELLAEAGFEQVEQQIVAQVRDEREGEGVLNDPFIAKHGTSELALLSDEAYEAGLACIRHAIARAEAVGKVARFQTNIDFTMTVGIAAQA